MIKVGSRVKIVTGHRYKGATGVVTGLATGLYGTRLAKIVLDGCLQAGIRSGQNVRDFLSSLEELSDPVQDMLDSYSSNIAYSTAMKKRLHERKEDTIVGSLSGRLILKEEAQMKLFNVTKVTALKDGGYAIEEKNVVAADQDAAKMKSGLMATNVEDADYATWYVATVMDVKTRDAEKK